MTSNPNAHESSTSTSNNGNYIFVYTRDQAIEDGVLVDVTQMAREAGFRYPVAVTQRVYAEVLTPDPAADGQSVNGRLWDLLAVLRHAARSTSDSEVRFAPFFLMGTSTLRSVELRSLCGPGDDGEPVVTVMFPDED